LMGKNDGIGRMSRHKFNLCFFMYNIDERKSLNCKVNRVINVNIKNQLRN